MAGQSRKWMILVGTIWIQAFTGTNFDFSAYSTEMKAALGVSQVQLNYLATASDLGKAFGWSSGLALMWLPVWAVMLVAAVMGLVGYGLQWLVLVGVFTPPYFLPVEWGQMNMVEAERRLLASALLDPSNQRFVLHSETCIPLFGFPTIYSYLINSTKSYIQVYDEKGATGRGRYDRHMSPQIDLSQWRKGSQWFEMDRELAENIILDQTYFPVFKNYCNNKCYGDEHYLPTYVAIKYWEKNSNRTITWVDWSIVGPHPGKFERPRVTIDFLQKLRNDFSCEYNGEKTNICYLFARKFMPSSLTRLLRFGPKVFNYG